MKTEAPITYNAWLIKFSKGEVTIKDLKPMLIRWTVQRIKEKKSGKMKLNLINFATYMAPLGWKLEESSKEFKRALKGKGKLQWTVVEENGKKYIEVEKPIEEDATRRTTSEADIRMQKAQKTIEDDGAHKKKKPLKVAASDSEETDDDDDSSVHGAVDGDESEEDEEEEAPGHAEDEEEEAEDDDGDASEDEESPVALAPPPMKRLPHKSPKVDGRSKSGVKSSRISDVASTTGGDGGTPKRRKGDPKLSMVDAVNVLTEGPNKCKDPFQLMKLQAAAKAYVFWIQKANMVFLIRNLFLFLFHYIIHFINNKNNIIII